MKTISIRELLADERPRERCLRLGTETLSLRECIAVILGSGPKGIGCMGIARQILSKAQISEHSESENDFFHQMEHQPESLLSEIKGLGPAGQSRILCLIEIAKRYAIFRERNRSPEKKSNSTLKRALQKRIPNHLISRGKEWFGFIPTRLSGELGSFVLVENGVRTEVNFEIVDFFAKVLATRPSGVYLLHSHPSGEKEPSSADIEITERIRSVLIDFGISFLGHWIVTTRGLYLIQVPKR